MIVDQNGVRDVASETITLWNSTWFAVKKQVFIRYAGFSRGRLAALLISVSVLDGWFTWIAILYFMAKTTISIYWSIELWICVRSRKWPPCDNFNVIRNWCRKRDSYMYGNRYPSMGDKWEVIFIFSKDICMHFQIIKMYPL